MAGAPLERANEAAETPASERVQELLDAHARYPSLFDDSHDPMLLLTRRARLARSNKAFLRLAGGTAEQFAGRGYLSLLGNAHRKNLIRNFVCACRGESRDFMLTLVNASGRELNLRIELTPARVEAAIVGAYALLTNLTSLRRFEEKNRARALAELGSLFHYHSDAIAELDAEGRIVNANEACERLIGYATGDLRGNAFAELGPPGARAGWSKLIERGMRGRASSARLTLAARDARRIEVAATVVPILVDGQVTGVHAIARDVTEQHRRENANKEQTRRLRELYYVVASTGRGAEQQIEAALEMACKHLGCEAGYLAHVESGTLVVEQGVGAAASAHGRTLPLERSLHRFVLEAGHAIAIAEIAPGRPDDPTGLSPRAFIAAPLVVGGIRWGTVAFLTTRPRVEKFAAGDRDFVRLFGVFVEGALERLNQERRLDALAFSDALTGLPNRLLLDDRLSQTIASAQRHGTSFALHFYDLDGFKSINDRHGHLRGDEVLRAVAHRMERTARQEDTVARIGGDEFVVLQPTIHGVSDAERLAERVRHAISDEPFFVDGRDHRLTASAGIAVYPDHGSEPAALLAAADAALYRVKASGRDAVALATRTPESRS